MKKYMHTIRGHPAVYYEGQQIGFANKSFCTSDLANTLRQVRKEQNLSIQWRIEQGFIDPKDKEQRKTEMGKYGYHIIRLDTFLKEKEVINDIRL